MLKVLLLGALLILLALQGASVNNLQNNGIRFDGFSQKAVNLIQEFSSLLQATQTEKTSNRKNRWSLNDDLPLKRSSQGLTDFTGQNITYQENGFNAGTLITDKQILLINYNQNRPSLWKIDLQSGKLGKVSFSFPYPDPSLNQTDILNYLIAPPLLFDLNNGDIALTYYNYLKIVDKQTLAVKQVFQGKDLIDNVKQILSFHDQATNQTRYYFCRQISSCLAQELIRLPTGQYTTIKKQFIFDSSVLISTGTPFKTTMTSLNSAVYLESCNIRYFKITDSIVGFSSDQKYYLKKRVKVAVSHDESFFIMRNQEGGFEFYNFGEDFEPTLNQTISISNEYKLLKGATTSDDRFLFFSLSAGDQILLAKVDIANGQYTFLTDNDNLSKVVDFHLFDASHDLMVTVQPQAKSYSYILYLRKVSDMSVVRKLTLAFQIPIDGYRLIGNLDWGLSFGLAVRTKRTTYDLQKDGKLLMYRVQGNKIISDQVSQDITFDNLFAVSRYAVTFKKNFPTIRVFHFSNMSLATTIPFQIDGYYFSADDISYEKDILMLSMLSRRQELRFYNFSESLESTGSLLTGEFTFTDTNYLHVLFPTRKVLYTAANFLADSYDFYTAPATKIVYNISQLPIYKTVKILENQGANQHCYYDSYVMPSKLSKDKCNFVLYILCNTIQYDIHCYGRKIIKYDVCTKTNEEYVIEQKQRFYFSVQFVSSDQKYFIVLMRSLDTGKFWIEIRPIDSLNTTYFKRVFDYQYKIWNQRDDYKADIINGNDILIQGPNFITLYKIKENKHQQTKQQLTIEQNSKVGTKTDSLTEE